MALIIHGSPRSRTMRTLWAAEELGLDYELNLMEWDDPRLKSPEFLALNPAGSIPTIVDDGFALSESLAINLYLARKYGGSGEGSLYPCDPEDEALTWRWTLWAQGQLEPWVQRDLLWLESLEPIREAAAPLLDRALDLLNGELAQRPWLVADRFTVADLNVAAVLSPSRSECLDLDGRPAVRDWLGRCYGRPAARAARARYAA
jgi:glutathione S-transferase